MAFRAERFIGRHFHKESSPLVVVLLRSTCSNIAVCDESTSTVEIVHRLSKQAIDHCGSDNKCLRALTTLGKLCCQRQPLTVECIGTTSSRGDGSVMSIQRNLLPHHVTAAFLDHVAEMEHQGWLSTNPDSVDGLPSLHLNLVSQGKPKCGEDPAATHDPSDDFHLGTQQLLKLVETPIYQDLLPKVQRLVNDPNLVVSEVFLRRYNQDIGRSGISAHFDVYSKVTAVIAMDDVSADGRNGLYTVLQNNYHSSLRRFVPLSKGDCVVHSWDVLHGVDVEPGLDRTSLIVWFSTRQALEGEEESFSCAPWLLNHADVTTNDLVQFVLASASENAMSDESTVPPFVLPAVGDSSSSSSSLLQATHFHDWYLESASRGNVLAMNRLGALCKEQELTESQQNRAMSILNSAHNVHDLPCSSSIHWDNSLSRRFWYEGSIRGHPLSQISLADDLMAEASTSGDVFSVQSMCIMAACLFGLAAQQGNEAAADALKRVVEFHVLNDEQIRDRESFLASPVVKVSMAATIAMDS